MATKKTAGKKAVAKKSAATGRPRGEEPGSIEDEIHEIHRHVQNLELHLKAMNDKLMGVFHDFAGEPPPGPPRRRR